MEIHNAESELVNMDQYLTFVMDDEEYGIDILSVQEIRGWEEPTKIPNSPKYLKGVINLRGTIVPIIDLRLRFQLMPVEYTEITVVIVLRLNHLDEERTIGIVVDAVSDVHSMSKSDVHPPPDFSENQKNPYVKGLAKVDKKMVIILDLNELLKDEQVSKIQSS